MVKLTQGTSYENPYAAMQYQAWANVMHDHGHVDPKVGFYNYATGYNGVANARYFLAWLKAFDMSKDTAVALDFEDPSVAGNGEVNEWLAEIKKAGYKNVSVYSMASWFGEKLSTVAIQTNNFWFADYGSMPTLVRSKYYKTAWQFSDNYKGLGVDMSLDYGHILVPDVPKTKRTAKPIHQSVKKPANKVSKKSDIKSANLVKPVNKHVPQYAKYRGVYRVNQDTNLYSDFTLKNKVATLPRNGIVNAQPVLEGSFTRLLTNSGFYLVGRVDNPSWVKLVKRL